MKTGKLPADLLARLLERSIRRDPRVLVGPAIGEDDSMTPRLHIENHLRILRALWEQSPSQMYHRIACPVLIIPAHQENPTSERAAQLNAHKEMVVAMAEQRLPRSQTVWMKDTVHDVPVHRPRELAEAIARFSGGGDEAVL